MQTPSKCSVQLLARGTEKLYSLELSPKGALRDYDYCLLFSSKSPVLPIMLIIFLLLVSLEKEQAKLWNMVQYYPGNYVLKEKLSRSEVAVLSSALS